MSHPSFPSSEGEFAVDFRDYNGAVDIGSGDWQFRTMWTTAGQGKIHTYSDRGVQVAVAPSSATKIESVTEDVFEGANFSSRARSPSTGQVVLLRNPSGYAAAIEIGKVRVTTDGDPGTVLAARYRILTDSRSRNFSGARNQFAPLHRAVVEANEALAAAAQASPPGDPAEIGIGHNQPPPESAMTRAEVEELSQTLDSMGTEIAIDGGLSSEQLDDGARKISTAVARIAAWAKRRFALIEEGFFRQVGASSLLIGAGYAWLVLSGKLEVVLEAIKAIYP